LVTALTFCTKGHNVTCIDIDSSKISSLSSGLAPFYEPGLSELLSSHIQTGLVRFRLFEDICDQDFDFIFLCVGTPADSSGNADLSQLISASKSVALLLRTFDQTIVVKSTVPPTTTIQLVSVEISAASHRARETYGLAMCPEFLREGSAIADSLNPDRIVIGTDDDISRRMLLNLYSSFSCPKSITTTPTAEFAKYANNCLLAAQISVSNELFNISLLEDSIDFDSVLEVVKHDYRWRCTTLPNPSITSYLTPGPGYGGSCFPKDVQALSSFAQQRGIRAPLLDCIHSVNINQPAFVAQTLIKRFQITDRTNILFLGLSFKPSTTDVRDTPAYGLISSLLKATPNITLHDPLAVPNFRLSYPEIVHNLKFTDDYLSASSNSDLVIICTQWNEYTSKRLADKASKLVDLRRTHPLYLHHPSVIRL